LLFFKSSKNSGNLYAAWPARLSEYRITRMTGVPVCARLQLHHHDRRALCLGFVARNHPFGRRYE
jgi:hypothetical protein